ncbi:hypothetical protein [Nocardiopsis nanhaiensis]
MATTLATTDTETEAARRRCQEIVDHRRARHIIASTADNATGLDKILTRLQGREKAVLPDADLSAVGAFTLGTTTVLVMRSTYGPGRCPFVPGTWSCTTGVLPGVRVMDFMTEDPDVTDSELLAGALSWLESRYPEHAPALVSGS